MEEWNRACMVNHLWDILHEKDSLWVKWIYAKYIKLKSIWSIEQHAYNSWAWKGIIYQRAWLLQHIQLKVGNGRNFNLWYDPWVNGKSINDLAGDRIREVLGLSHNLHVSHFISDGSWNLPPPTCPEMLTLWPIIQDIHIEANAEDHIMWNHDNIKYTKKGVWELIRMRNPSTPWYHWVWSSPTVPKFSVCMW